MAANKKNLMKSIMKRAAVIGCSTMLMLGSAIPAFAQGDDPEEATETTQTVQETETTETEQATETQDESTDTSVLTERVIGEDTTTAFSVSGNAEVVDDITDSESKEFYTIRTANNNTFYLIVDRSATTDNVYMLSTIDENDLEEFLDETEDTASSTVVAIPENTVTEETQTDDSSATEEEVQTEETTSKGMNTGAIAALIVLVIGGAGAAYYFKKVKPAQDTESDTSEGMEYGENIRYEEDDDYISDERIEEDVDSSEDDGLDEDN